MKKLRPGDVQVGGLFSRTLWGHVGGGYTPALQSSVPPRCPPHLPVVEAAGEREDAAGQLTQSDMVALQHHITQGTALQRR